MKRTTALFVIVTGFVLLTVWGSRWPHVESAPKTLGTLIGDGARPSGGAGFEVVWPEQAHASRWLPTSNGGQNPQRVATKTDANPKTRVGRASQEPSPPPEQRRLHPIHPVQPVVRLAPGANTPQAALPINSTSWTPLGPAPILNGWGSQPASGRLTGIAAHPTDANTIYVAAAGGGVWKTTNSGSTWTSLTDSQMTLSMGAIAVAPSNPNVVYAGTGEANNSVDSNFGRGILISTDAGVTWTLSTSGGAFDQRTVSEIAIDPTNANVAYATVQYGTVCCNTGVWKTTNGGVTWSNTTSSITSFEAWSSVEMDPNNQSTVYAAVGSYGGSTLNGVYKSTNGGSSWTLMTNAPKGSVAGRIVLAVAKTNSQVVYVSASGTAVSGSSSFGSLYKFMRSDDGGFTFTDLTPGTPNYLGSSGWYDTTLIVDPANSALVYAGGSAGTHK